MENNLVEIQKRIVVLEISIALLVAGIAFYIVKKTK